ncbi:class I SAM-dependent methyltransferase [Schlesneria paludicola]|uniref:class I SAM-dependent methyltransferase n=1 Tax=Schlesneria paludicola TaxID=360056 RepID=UPI00029B366B|nr:class I SAM-dependent methyltransferase [Schlesneria paludicola]
MKTASNLRKRKSNVEPLLDDRKSLVERDADLLVLLDQTHRALLTSNGNREQVGMALDGLFGGVNQMRLSSPPDHWEALIQTCRNHPILPTLHEDPFTGRAFAKPRGYAGDAELIDLIYGPEDRMPEPKATPLGLDIYRYTSSAPAAEGVRARRGFITDLIDQTTTERPGQDILAIAAGHLREANLTTALRRRRIGRFVALDSDPISLQEVERAYGPYGVQTVPSSFGPLITNRLQIGTFDLVYTTGLYDYLSLNTGRRLVTTMFDMLNPGGQLVVANFLPGIRDIGFMEAFMDWKLIYRSRQDMVNLTAEIEESEISHLSLFAEENQNIIFLRVTKK